jgi:aspartate carbamoyltransferase catalytic subunit
LLDLCVIKSIFKNKKIKIGICGDIKHSRVAHSNIKLLSKLNHEIHIIAPNYFLDKAELVKINKKLVFHKSLSKLPKLDVIMMLRIQKERISRNAKSYMNSFKKDFCLNSNHLKNQPFLMHPGPVNRNIEIDSKVLDNYPKSLILRQVDMGVYLRMACLDFILK